MTSIETLKSRRHSLGTFLKYLGCAPCLTTHTHSGGLDRYKGPCPDLEGFPAGRDKPPRQGASGDLWQKQVWGSHVEMQRQMRHILPGVTIWKSSVDDGGLVITFKPIPHHQRRLLASCLYCLVLLHTRSVHGHFHPVTPQSVLWPLLSLPRKPSILLSPWTSEIKLQVPERRILILPHWQAELEAGWANEYSRKPTPTSHSGYFRIGLWGSVAPPTDI